MQDKEFYPIFRNMAIAYGERMKDTPETMEVYFMVLEDLPTELVKAAALEYIASPKAFPPTPGEIRAKAIEVEKRINRVPSADEAWREIHDAPADGIVKSHSVNQGENKDVYPWVITMRPYEFSHPMVEMVARNLGWPERFWTSNLASDRARFMDTYNKVLERETRHATSLPQVKEYIEARGQGDIKSLVDGFRREALDRGEGE